MRPALENMKLVNYEDRISINRNLTTSSLVLCFDSRP